MQLAFNFDIDDWFAFQKHYIKYSTYFAKLRRRLVIFCVVIIGFFSVLGFVEGKTGAGITLAIFALITIISVPKVLNILTARNARKMIEKTNRKTGNLFGPISIEFTEEKIITQTPQSGSNLLWTALTKVEETPDSFFSVHFGC